MFGKGFAKLLAALHEDNVVRGRRVGKGIRSRVFADAHAVERARHSKYPNAVSVSQTGLYKVAKREENYRRRINRIMDDLLEGDWS